MKTPEEMLINEALISFSEMNLRRFQSRIKGLDITPEEYIHVVNEIKHWESLILELKTGKDGN